MNLVQDSSDIVIAIIQDAIKRNKYWNLVDIRSKYYAKLANRYLLTDVGNKRILELKKIWYGKYDKIDIVDSAYVKENGLWNCMTMGVFYEKDTIRVSFSGYRIGTGYSYLYQKNKRGKYEYLREREIRFKPKHDKFWSDVRKKSDKIMGDAGFDLKSFYSKEFVEKDSFYIYLNSGDELIKKEGKEDDKFYYFYYEDYRKLHLERIQRSKQLNDEAGKSVVDMPNEPCVIFKAIDSTKTILKLPIDRNKLLNRESFRSYHMRTKGTVFFLLEENKNRGYRITPSKIISTVW